jgi:hypothetical protein
MADLTHGNLLVGTTFDGAACQYVMKLTISPATGEAPDEDQGSERQQSCDERSEPLWRQKTARRN